jgi:hypothetical protein
LAIKLLHFGDEMISFCGKIETSEGGKVRNTKNFTKTPVGEVLL